MVPAGLATAIMRRLAVCPVSVPESNNRIEIVVRRGERRLELLDLRRWAALAPSEVTNAGAPALEVALAYPGTRVRVDGATIGTSAAQRVAIDVQHFDVLLGLRLVFDTSWPVLDAKSALLGSSQTRRGEPAMVSADGAVNGEAEAIAAAAGHVIGRMTNQIATERPAPTQP